MNPRVVEIKKWLLDKGLRQIDLAVKAQTTRHVVNDAIHGRRWSRKVAELLRALGCPVDFSRKAA